MSKSARKINLLQSGIILSVVGFLTQGIHYGFQAIVSPLLGGQKGEFGLVITTISFIGFLALPLTIATQAVTHYVARFHISGEDARLNALLAGCRKFLLHITVAGSVLAIILVKPLGHYFEIPRTGLTVIALVCVLGGLWSAYVVALCQGLGWFKRMALIGLLAAVLRVVVGLPLTHLWPVAESAVLASVVMLLPNLILFYWRKDFPKQVATAESPWNQEFVQFLIVSAAYVIGSYCFSSADQLVANKFFAASYKESLDAYSSAGLLARALPNTAGPLLVVLFTHRSGRNHKDGLGDQMKLFGLYALGLILGAAMLYLLRGFCLQILHRNTPEAAGMVGHLAMTMVFAGLIQALGTWSLASRWLKVSLLYGVLGVTYWLTLLTVGLTPPDLLGVMPVALGTALAIMLVIWLNTMYRQHPPTPEL